MVARKQTKKIGRLYKGFHLPKMADNQAQQQLCFGCHGYLETREHDCLKSLTKRLNRQRLEVNRLTRLVEKQKSVSSLHNLVVSLVKRVQDLEEYKISESSRTELLYRQIDQLKRQNKVLLAALEDLGKTNSINNNNDSNNSNPDLSANNEANSGRSSSTGCNNNRVNRNNNNHNKDNSNSGGDVRDNKRGKSDILVEN